MKRITDLFSCARKRNKMRRYHLTVVRDGKYETIFEEISSIELFLALERYNERDTHIIYCREISRKEYMYVKELGVSNEANRKLL